MARLALVLVAVLALTLPSCAGIDDDALLNSGPKVPTEWRFPVPRPLNILVVHGKWYPNYGMERAFARLGGARVTDAWVSPKRLRCYPDSFEQLMNQHLIIVCNTNANNFGKVNRAMLKQYVAAGGSILFLGGKYAYGPSSGETAFEEIAPVTFTATDDRRFEPNGLPLAAGPERIGDGFTRLPWIAVPRVFWYHDVQLKAGSKVLLTAGGKPLLIAGTFGKGRVVVFAGSVMGDPAPGLLPFWEWERWPDIAAATITWLVGPAVTPMPMAGPEQLADMRQQLHDCIAKPMAIFAPILTHYSRLCMDAGTARLLLETLANRDGDVPVELFDTVWDACQPYVNQTFHDITETLLQATVSTKISLGLRMLGAIKAADARPTIEKWLRNPGEVEPGDPLDNPTLETVAEDTSTRVYRIRLGAFESLGLLGDPAALPALQEYIRQYLRQQANPANKSWDNAQETELYQEALIASLRCGDRLAVVPTVDSLLESRFSFIAMLGWYDHDPGSDNEWRARVARIRRMVPLLQQRMQRQYRKLTALPPTVLEPLAQRLTVDNNIGLIPIAFAAFGESFRTVKGTVLPREALAVLRKSPQPAIADLGLAK